MDFKNADKAWSPVFPQNRPMSMLLCGHMLEYFHFPNTRTHITTPRHTSPPTDWSADLLLFVAGAAHLAE